MRGTARSRSQRTADKIGSSVAASEAFADNLGSEAEISSALSAAQMRYVAVQVLVGSGNVICGVRRLCRGGFVCEVGARFAAVEGNGRKEVGGED